MPDDDRRPRITRTNSLFTSVTRSLPGARDYPVLGPPVPRPNSNPFGRRASGSAATPEPEPPRRGTPPPAPRDDGLTFIANPSAGSASRNVQSLVPRGFEFVRAVPGGLLVRPRGSNAGEPGYRAPETAGTGRPGSTGSFYSEFLNEQLRSGRLGQAINANAQTINGVTVGTAGEATEAETEKIGANGQAASVFGPLNLSDLDPSAQFRFDRAAPIDPATGERTGVLQRKGVYGSADSLERQLEPGQTNPGGTNENIMTISAGVLWLRNLAARDRAAYNKLVVLLRNAGYGNLSANDAELPLNGYSQQAGVAFALAANDLAQANAGDDKRTLLEYLTDRGKGYADYLAQEEADRAAEQYQPVERRYQDPATLRATAKEAAIDALGRKLTDEEEARFEAAFRAREDVFYDQIDAAGRGKTAFRGYAPDVAGQVSDFVEGDEFETEAAANRIGEYSQVFMRLMGGGG